MTLDPEQSAIIQQLVEAADPNAPSLWDTPPELVNEAFKPLVAFQGPPQDAQSEDLTVNAPSGDMTLRIYRPTNGAPDNGPAVYFIHGGGWVINDIDFYDPLCRNLTNDLGCVVASVDYARAPGSKFPGPVVDCWAGLQYLIAQASDIGIGPSRIAIMGDSAGGNLAAAMTLKCKAEGAPALVAQVLHVPVTDHNFETASSDRNGEGYVLIQDFMKWFWHHYLSDAADGANPLTSPMQAEDLSGLPPALIKTCEYDPLVDEGAAYAKRLQGAGVDVSYTEISGTTHDPYLFFAALPKGAQAIEEAVGFLKERLN